MENAHKVPNPDPLWRVIFNRFPLTLASHRMIVDGAVSLLPMPPGAKRRVVSLNGRPATWTSGFEDGSGRIILYLHGGGYSMGSIRSHRSIAAYLGFYAGARVLLIDYRRAPEHPYPAALEDALAAYRSLLEAGADPNLIAVSGDSAGGGLSLALLLALRDQGLPLPAAAFLMSPWVDLTKSHRPFDIGIPRRRHIVDWNADLLASMYAGDQDPAHPYISPVYGDLTGLPPLLVHAGRTEPLRMDGRRIVERARECGVSARFVPYNGPIHVVQAVAPMSRRVRRLLAQAGTFLKANVPGD